MEKRVNFYPGTMRMRHSFASDVRHLVADTFTQLGLSCGSEPQETILIRDGMYCGRRFDVERGHAVWFVEEQQVKFFRSSGSVAHIIELAALAPATRRLAA